MDFHADKQPLKIAKRIACIEAKKPVNKPQIAINLSRFE
jgi:hypothetical protein